MSINASNFLVTRVNGTTYNLYDKTKPSTVVSAKQAVELLSSDVIDITVKSGVPIVFNIGDRITVIGRDYTLNTPAKEKKASHTVFMYDLHFEGAQYDLLRACYNVNVDTTSGKIQDLSGDGITGDIKLFLDVLVVNANRVFGSGKWAVGTYPSGSKTITLTFSDSDNCLSVLQSLCSEENYNTEFSISIDGYGHRTINVGTIGTTFPFTIEYGKGKGIYELTREKVSSSNIITRLNCYGGSKNIITSKYRAAKLCLPTKTKSQSYIEDSIAVTKYGVWENTKNFDDIYPHREGTVSSLGESELKFIDSSMDFDLNAKDGSNKSLYLISGTSAKIHFNTGNLAGYEFELNTWDNSSKKFTLIKQTDENGYTFPSSSSSAFQIAVGDKYTITDIYMPQSYIDNAETALSVAGTAYLDKYKQPLVQYGLTVDSLYLKTIVGANAESNIIWVGDYIHIKDTDIDVDKSIRIKGFTRDLLLDYYYQLTIADLTVTVSTISRVITELNGLDKVVKINNLNDPAKARRNWMASQEVLNMVFDPEGDFYTDKIKPLSIDTTMLSVGAKSMQFGLEGTIFQPNYAGAKNRVVYAGGSLTHYAIVDTNSNPRTWTIADGDLTLTSDVAHYVYAKCAKVGTGASILFSTSKISSESDATYYHFLIGILNSVDSNNTRALALMYGFTTVNGRFIKTGRIQSADGNTYFDLDAGEFKGNFKFTTGETIQEAISSSVDNIQIGGRNLLELSNIEKVGASEYLEYCNTTSCFNKHGVGQYMLSFDLTADVAGTVLVYSTPNNLSTFKYIFDPSNITATTSYQRFSIPINVTVSNPSSVLSSLSFYGTYGSGRIVHVKNVKIELGNKSTDWTPAPEDVAADATAKANAAADLAYANSQSYVNIIKTDLQSQIDGNITSWFYDYEPTPLNVPASSWSPDSVRDIHLGDLFYWISKGWAYRYQKVSGVYSWTRISDTDVTKALNDAATAQTIANGKRTTFAVEPTTPYLTGDLWLNSGDLYSCNVARATGQYVASDWSKGVKYTDDTAAVAAQTTASNAATAAINAQSSADTANSLLSDIASDNKLTAVEKQQTKKEWDSIVSEKAKNDDQADSFAVSKIAYGTAYTSLSNYIVPLLSGLTSTSDIVGTTFRNTFKAYYDARTDLLNAIAAKSKALANTAQEQANTATTNAAAAQYQADTATSNAAAAQSTANSAASAASLAQTQIAALNYLKDALTGSTDISGGLVGTNVILIKTLAGAISGGMSGISSDNIGMWTGGTYAEALSAIAKIILRKDGSGQLAGGKINWDAGGGMNVGMFNIFNNLLSSGNISFTSDALENLADIAGSVSSATSPGQITANSSNGHSATVNSSVFTLSKNSYIKFRVVQEVGISETDYARLYVNVVKNNVSTVYTSDKSIDASSNATNYYDFEINLPAGDYYLTIAASMYGSSSSNYETATVTGYQGSGSNITIQPITSLTKIANNGFYSFWGTSAYLYLRTDFGFQVMFGSYGIQCTTSGLKKTNNGGSSWTSL